MNDGSHSYFDKLFSSDSEKVIFIENTPKNDDLHRVVVTDRLFNKLYEKEFRIETVIYNADRSRMALVEIVNDKKRVVAFSFDKSVSVSEGPMFDTVAFPVFGKDGVSLAYVGEKGGKRYLVLNAHEELLPDGDVVEPPVIRPDLKSAGVIIATKNGSYLHQPGADTGGKARRYEESALLAYNSSGDSYAFAAKNGKGMFYVVNGKESPAFDKVLEPLFSPDGKLIVGRVRKDGKRFVVVLNNSGQIVRQHPDYEMVFNPVFTADGKSVAYGVKDGSRLIWKVEKL
jgi:hypothetical protein